MSWTETHICSSLSLFSSSLLMFSPQNFSNKWCLSWIPLPYSAALEEFAGCMQMASVTIMMALPWHLGGGWDALGPTETWANKTTGKEEGQKRWVKSKRKRISPLLLLASRRWICLISGFMTAFEALRFFSYHKEPITQTGIYDLSCLCKHQNKQSLMNPQTLLPSPLKLF